MVSEILYYGIYASAILLYGVGLDRSVYLSKKTHDLFLSFLKAAISVISSAAICFVIQKYLLAPVHLTEIYPFIAVLIFTLIAVFLETIIRITAKLELAEFSVSLLCLLLGLCEGRTIASCLLICFLAVALYWLFIPLLHVLRVRLELSPIPKDCKNDSIIFISIAVMMILLLVWNVSFLNPEVL